MPTSYWNPETVGRAQLLDTQRGQLIAVQISPAERETIMVGGQTVSAKRHQVSGDLDLDLWYTAKGEWVKTSFAARGSKIVYERRNGLVKRAARDFMVDD